MPIKIMALIQMSIDSDQCWSTQCRILNIEAELIRHWSILMGIDPYWWALIHIDGHWSILMGLDPYWWALIHIDVHWSILMGIDRQWSALIGIDVAANHENDTCFGVDLWWVLIGIERNWLALRGILDQCHDFDRHWALIGGVLVWQRQSPLDGS